MPAVREVDYQSFVDRLLAVNDLSQPSLTRCVLQAEIEQVIIDCRRVVMTQPPLIQLDPPINICGDIHGQYTDLLRVFNRCRYPSQTNYLFLGDYVDRGKQQLETICLLMAYKILFPTNFFILRGNHECRSINKVYGFYEECKRRYNTRLWESFQCLFNCLPFSALVGGRIFCMHGGLSPDLMSWDQLDDINRPIDPPNRSLHMDLLWSDPEQKLEGWAANSRGVSYIFGEGIVHEFCLRMDIDLVARGHQVVQDGYEFFADRKLVTIFTASSYCGEFDNNGAIMVVGKQLECSFEVLRANQGVIKVRSTKNRSARRKKK
ncbi:unnamed protein product, partial [Mesorhabditis spiculigera]